MANITFENYTTGLGAAGTLNGTELVPVVQSGSPVKLSLQAINATTRTSAEIAAGVTPTNYAYPPGTIPRYMSAAQLADWLAGSHAVDQTSAFNTCQLVTNYVPIPPGKYLITSGITAAYTANPFAAAGETGSIGTRFVGPGNGQALIYQGATGTPIFTFTTNTTSGNTLDYELSGVKLAGVTSATVPVVQINALNAAALWRSKFDFECINAYQALNVNSTGTNFFDNETTIFGDGFTTTAVSVSSGTYNKWRLFLTNCTGTKGVATTTTLVGGSGYTNGSYNNVPLTGGTGTGARAAITVAGGAVTVVTIYTVGSGYTANDVLSASNTNLGGGGSGFTVTVATIGGSSALIHNGINDNVSVVADGQIIDYGLNVEFEKIVVENLAGGALSTAQAPIHMAGTNQVLHQPTTNLQAGVAANAPFAFMPSNGTVFKQPYILTGATLLADPFGVNTGGFTFTIEGPGQNTNGSGSSGTTNLIEHLYNDSGSGTQLRNVTFVGDLSQFTAHVRNSYGGATQYLAPGTTNFNQNVFSDTDVMIVDNSGTVATGQLNITTGLVDRRELAVFFTSAVTTMTFSSSATFVPAAPTAISAGQKIKWVYRATQNKFYQVD